MSEENTQNLTDGRSFEERVFARFDALERELKQTRREFTKRLDKIEMAVLETRAWLGETEDRLEKLEESGPAK